VRNDGIEKSRPDTLDTCAEGITDPGMAFYEEYMRKLYPERYRKPEKRLVVSLCTRPVEPRPVAPQPVVSPREQLESEPLPKFIPRGKSKKRGPRRKRKRILSPETKRMVLERDGYCCFFCKAKKDLHVHHMIPRSKGGSHDMENLLTVCESCHAWLHEGEPVHKLMVKRMNNKTA
jgi:5-methylcytosine-specific restriction endonuclease McrA